jgi:hypothetical protein
MAYDVRVGKTGAEAEVDGYDNEALREETKRQLEIARAQRELARRIREKVYERLESAYHALASDRERERVANNREAWNLYVETERREIRLRQEGHLAKLLGFPLPGESEEELERLTEEDRLMALEGLV